jgi:hypothetical protein
MLISQGNAIRSCRWLKVLKLMAYINVPKRCASKTTLIFVLQKAFDRKNGYPLKKSQILRLHKFKLKGQIFR